jgi:hypothetical protein
MEGLTNLQYLKSLNRQPAPGAFLVGATNNIDGLRGNTTSHTSAICDAHKVSLGSNSVFSPRLVASELKFSINQGQGRYETLNYHSDKDSFHKKSSYIAELSCVTTTTNGAETIFGLGHDYA